MPFHGQAGERDLYRQPRSDVAGAIIFFLFWQSTSTRFCISTILSMDLCEERPTLAARLTLIAA